MGLAPDCLTGRQDRPVSHDELYSTVLGMMDIRTETRDPALDLMSGCEATPS